MASQPPVPQHQPSRHEASSDQRSSPVYEASDQSEKATTDSSSSPFETAYPQADATASQSDAADDPPTRASASQANATTTADLSSSVAPQTPSSEPRKCWICFADETEDSPESSVWRTPCPCALTAHESCLLDWVADLEGPTSRQKSTTIQCPQCKAPIAIARPSSPVASAVRAADRFTARLVLPGVLGAVGAGVWAGAFMHGMWSLFVVFGHRDFERLLEAAASRQLLPGGGGDWTGAFVPLTWATCVPLIPVSLILSHISVRGGSALPALGILAALPTLGGGAPEWAGAPGDGEGLWPPSAALTFAVLPYVRVAYSRMMHFMFAEHERRWVATVRPRAAEGAEEQHEHDHHHHHHEHDHDHDHHHHHHHEHRAEDEGEAIIQLDIGVDIDVFDNDEAAPAPNVPRGPNDNAAGDAQAGGAAARADGANNQNNNNGAQGHWILNTVRFADAFVGALAFPAVAAVAGHALRLALPAAWTAAPARLSARPGLLQSQWGRSVVGGCLFIVVKDALLLYARYRTAMDHGKRRVVDWKGERRIGKEVGKKE